MLTRSIRAPLGAGMPQFVAEVAKAEGRNDILVIVAHREIAEQWLRAIPNARVHTQQSWQRDVLNEQTLVIVDSLQSAMWRAIEGKMHGIRNDVWLCNMIGLSARGFVERYNSGVKQVGIVKLTNEGE